MEGFEAGGEKAGGVVRPQRWWWYLRGWKGKMGEMDATKAVDGTL